MELTPQGASTKALLDAAVASFFESQKYKTFSERHPELGKMVNCKICNMRHRSIHVCEQEFVTLLTPPEGLTSLTKNQIIGKAAFAKKRINPHYSKKRLQLVQRTIELFPEHNIWPSTETKSAEQVGMEVARRFARVELAGKRNTARAGKRAVQDRSRRINSGLLAGNSAR